MTGVDVRDPPEELSMSCPEHLHAIDISAVTTEGIFLVDTRYSQNQLHC